MGAVEPLIGEAGKKLKNIINRRKSKKEDESGPDIPMDYSAGKRDTPQNI